MRKAITVVLVMALVFGIAITGSILAKDGGNEGNDYSEERTKAIRFSGTVIHKDANDITISRPNKEFIHIIITLNNETKFFDGTGDHEPGDELPEIKIANIKKGDKIIARGEIDREEDVPAIFVAETVTKINSFQKPEGESDKNIPLGMHVVLKSIDDESITVTNPAGENEQTFSLNDDIKVYKLVKDENGKPIKEAISIVDLEEGDKIAIKFFKEKDENGDLISIIKHIVVVDEFPSEDDVDVDEDEDEESEGKNVLLVSIDDETITVTNPAGKNEQTFTFDDDIEIFKLEVDEDGKASEVKISADDLVEGDKLILTVYKKRNEDGNVIAYVKKILAVDEFPSDDDDDQDDDDDDDDKKGKGKDKEKKDKKGK